jgi:hypothetical protein
MYSFQIQRHCESVCIDTKSRDQKNHLLRPLSSGQGQILCYWYQLKQCLLASANACMLSNFSFYLFMHILVNTNLVYIQFTFIYGI